MTYTLPWKKVYPDLPHLPPQQVKRLTIELPRADADTIHACTLNPAIFSLVCQTALRDTAAFIRTNNLDYAKPGHFTRLIDYIRERTVGQPPSQAGALDVAGRTPSGDDRVADVAEKSASPGKTAPSGGKSVTGRGRGRGGRGEGGEGVGGQTTGGKGKSG